MDYYSEIKSKLLDNEIYSNVKDYSKERYRVITYFEIGRLLCEAGSVYGEDIIGKYSEKLMIDVGKKYNKRTLFRMKQFYNIFSNEKVSTMLTQLSWSHFLLLLSMKDYDEIIYYINVTRNNNLTQRQLQDKIKSDEYKRLPIATRSKLIKKENIEIKDFVPDPILIKNSDNYELISEKILQKLILENISSFLKELGAGFTFVDNEYKIKINGRYNYIDLLLFNYEFNCFVVIELKITELRKEYIGQIEIYMNYIDKNIKSINQDNTIGIILCKKDNKFIMEYCSDDRILSREYELVNI